MSKDKKKGKKAGKKSGRTAHAKVAAETTSRRATHLEPSELEFLRDLNKETRDAFLTLSGKFENAVSIFGSARCQPGDALYKQTLNVSVRILESMKRAGKENCAIITGGGPCVMQAGLEGALERQAAAVGLNIDLPREQNEAPQTVNLHFSHFMGLRKYVFIRYSKAFVFMSGGFGTLDELFEVLTLMQTGLLDRKPIYLVGKDFWTDLDIFIRRHMLVDHFIGDDDPKLYKIVDHDEDFVDELVQRIIEEK